MTAISKAFEATDDAKLIIKFFILEEPPQLPEEPDEPNKIQENEFEPVAEPERSQRSHSPNNAENPFDNVEKPSLPDPKAPEEA